MANRPAPAQVLRESDLAKLESWVSLCVEEKSQIQALDRTMPILPMQDGRIERTCPFVWTKTSEQILAKTNHPTTSTPRH